MRQLFWTLLAVVALGLPVSRWLPEPVGGAWLLASLTLAALPVLAMWGGRPRWPLLWPVMAGLIGIAALAAWPHADDPRAHWLVAAQVALWVGIAPFSLTGLATRLPGAVRFSIGAFVLGQSVSAAAAIFQAFGVPTLGISALYGRSSGLAGHPNILGMLCGVSVLLLVARLRYSRSRFVWLLIALNIAGLLSSGSLSAMAAFAGGLVVYALVLRVRPATVVGAALAIGVVANLTASLAAVSDHFKTPEDRFLQVTGQTSLIGTASIRLATIEFASDRIAERPLEGWGLDDASGATFNRETLTHNLLVRSWFQGGAAAFVAFSSLFLAAAVAIWGAILRGEDATPAGVITIVLAFALTAATFQQGYFWLPLLGAWCSLRSRRAKEA